LTLLFNGCIVESDRLVIDAILTHTHV